MIHFTRPFQHIGQKGLALAGAAFRRGFLAGLMSFTTLAGFGALQDDDIGPTREKAEKLGLNDSKPRKALEDVRKDHPKHYLNLRHIAYVQALQNLKADTLFDFRLNNQNISPIKGLGWDEVTINSEFGYRPASATNGVGSTDHKGVDLKAVAGTPLVSVVDGIVDRHYVSGGGGGTIEISTRDPKTGRELEVRYVHVKPRQGLQPGDSVKVGEEIAVVAPMGYYGGRSSTGPHAHIEFAKNSTWLNRQYNASDVVRAGGRIVELDKKKRVFDPDLRRALFADPTGERFDEIAKAVDENTLTGQRYKKKSNRGQRRDLKRFENMIEDGMTELLETLPPPQEKAPSANPFFENIDKHLNRANDPRAAIHDLFETGTPPPPQEDKNTPDYEAVLHDTRQKKPGDVAKNPEPLAGGDGDGDAPEPRDATETPAIDFPTPAVKFVTASGLFGPYVSDTPGQEEAVEQPSVTAAFRENLTHITERQHKRLDGTSIVIEGRSHALDDTLLAKFEDVYGKNAYRYIRRAQRAQEDGTAKGFGKRSYIAKKLYREFVENTAMVEGPGFIVKKHDPKDDLLDNETLARILEQSKIPFAQKVRQAHGIPEPV